MDMMINELAVLASALLAIALGSIWYSPLVFGKHWQRAAGLTDSDLSLTPTELARSLIIALGSNLVVLTVVAYLIRIAEGFGYGVIQFVLGVTALLAASIASMVVWEKRSMTYFLIHTGYAVLVVVMGFVVIAYWPW